MGTSIGIRALDVTPDGSLLAGAGVPLMAGTGSDSFVALWHVPGGEPAATLRGQTGPIDSLAIDASGTLLAGARTGEAVCISASAPR